ncbi:MAG TPA: hypothetical protein PKN36_04195 [bacterium]|nr:hypothetical protein [bacterium]
MKSLYFIFLFATAVSLYSADYGTILKRNIFSPMKESQKENTDSPKATLPIIKLPFIEELVELKGTFFESRKSRDNIAILEDKKTKEMDFYRIGDTAGSALILDIDENRIIFDYGFQEIELTARGSNPVRIYPDTEYRLNIESVMQDFKKEVSENPGISSKPVFENGTIMGFMITGIGEESVISRFGIKNNDIITRINTVPLNSAEKPFYAYENIMKHGIKRVSIHLLRNNLPYTLLYHLN